MENYTCSICSKSFNRLYNFKRHINRKVPCKPLKLANVKQEKNKQVKKNNKEVDMNVSNDINKTKCCYCDAFISRWNLKKHWRNVCKNIPELEKNKIINKYNNNKTHINSVKLNSDNINITNNNSNKHTINNNGLMVGTINNNTTNNNNISLAIKPFGKEDISFITKEQKLKLVKRRYMGVPDLIATVHNNPVNQNFFQPNLNKKTLAYLDDDNTVKYGDYDVISDILIEKNMDRLNDFYHEVKDSLGKRAKEMITQVLIDNGDGKTNQRYAEEIKYYVMNTNKRNKKYIEKYVNDMENNCDIENTIKYMNNIRFLE